MRQPPPRFRRTIGDQRLRHVVHHERLVRVLFHQRQGSGELPRIDKYVVGEVEIAEHPDAIRDIRALEEIVWLSLCDMPYAPEMLRAGEVLESLDKVQGKEIDPPDNAQDSWMALGELQQEARLMLGLVGLHRDGAVHLELGKQGSQLLREIIPPQQGHVIRDPTVTDGIVMPEVLVGVDSHQGEDGSILSEGTAR